VFSSIAASGWIDHSWPEHAQIRNAIAVGDADGAGVLSRAHVLTACDWLLGHLGESAREPASEPTGPLR